MHELSIALSIVDAACEELARQPHSRIAAVHLRLGPLSGVVKDALTFSYDLACAGTPLEGSELRIEDVPIRIYCDRCHADAEPVSIQAMRCPRCGSPAARTVQGTELQVAALELCEMGAPA
jgi:hydrogenase nickel incorporation protein HypA/HybF